MRLNDCVNKQIIAWMFKPPYRDDFLLVNPQYLYSKTSGWKSISPDVFPNEGCIMVKPQGGYDAQDIMTQFGHLVVITLNDHPQCKQDERNWYSAKCNPDMPSGSSQIEIARFSAKGFLQVIETPESYETIQKNRGLSSIESNFYTNEVMIKPVENFCVGPFSPDVKETFTTLSANASQQYMVFCLKQDDLKDSWLDIRNTETGSISYSFFNTSNVDLSALSIHQFDWISDDKLLDAFAKTLRGSSALKYTRNQIIQIRNTVSDAMAAHCELEMTDARRKRIEHLLETVDNQDEYLQKIAYYILETESTASKLVDVICENYFEKIDGKVGELPIIQKRIAEKEKELADLQEQINVLVTDRSSLTRKEQENAQATIDKLNSEIDLLTARRDELTQVVSLGDSIEDLTDKHKQLQKQVEELRHEYDRQLTDKVRLEVQLKDTLSTFNDQSKAIAKALDSKLLNRVLREVGGEEYVEDESIDQFPSELFVAHLDTSGIISHVATHVREKANRDVSDNDIINYLICITQGFITTFAGEPGTGKTSLCNILSKALGLVRNDKYSRFVEVSVERGWTSHKDYIGYFNPLTKMLERSNSSVFNALKQLNTEADIAPNPTAPLFILLDEANLSPIEHYWAAFLKNCDTDSPLSRVISLGGKYTWRIPNHLRFLATVNFDHTTEDLSPRFLDRSWVIMLEPDLISDETLSFTEVENNNSVISFDNLLDAFSVRESDTIDELIMTKWNNIQRVFRNNGMQIMPRNLKMVRNYCLVACRCMQTDTPDARFAPLDYALAQKILPTINGTGEHYKQLIDDLLVECSGLPLCNKHLKRMKQIASKNIGFYEFFGRL